MERSGDKRIIVSGQNTNTLGISFAQSQAELFAKISIKKNWSVSVQSAINGIIFSSSSLFEPLALSIHAPVQY